MVELMLPNTKEPSRELAAIFGLLTEIQETMHRVSAQLEDRDVENRGQPIRNVKRRRAPSTSEEKSSDSPSKRQRLLDEEDLSESGTYQLLYIT
jgi:hypothetical protein